MPPLNGELADELRRAEAVLARMKGDLGDVVEIKRPDIAEAVFYGKIVSKLSPFVGNILENRIVATLNKGTPKNGLRWVRQDPDFPDAALVTSDGERTHVGYEVKAWYVLSTELTGRFRESQNLLEGKTIRLCVVPWMLSNIIYGHPVVLDVVTVDALSVAQSRDNHYHKPPSYLIAEPRDTKKRTRNLQQTNVAGYRLQEEEPSVKRVAEKFVEQHPGRTAQPHSEAAQEMVKQLMAKFAYRLDTNFSKIDRLQHDGVEDLKARILGQTRHGATLKQWSTILTQLECGTARQQEEAQEVIQKVYDQL